MKKGYFIKIEEELMIALKKKGLDNGKYTSEYIEELIRKEVSK